MCIYTYYIQNIVFTEYENTKMQATMETIIRVLGRTDDAAG